MSINMQIVISAIDNASQVIKKVEGSVKNASEKIKGMGVQIAKAGAVMSGIAAPFIGAMGMAIKTGIDFEQQMKNVQSVLGGTQKDFEILSNYAKEMGKSSVFSASEAAQAMYYMASAGMKTNDIMSSLNSTLQLAAATNSDLAQTSDVVVSTLSQFSLSADEASRVADVFASAISNSQASLDKIQYSMRYVGPVANSLGYSLEETTASLMMLYNAGFKGEQAGTILRGALSSLMNATSGAKDVLQKYNLEIYNTDGSLKNWGTILKQLESAHITTADAIKLFGQEAGPGIMAMINQGTDAFNNYLETLKKSEGAAQSMADTQINSVSGMVKLIKSELESIEISIFDDMKDEIQGILESIKSLLPLLKEFTEYFIQGFKDVLDAIKPFGKKLLDMFKNISPELKKTMALIGGLGVAFAAIAGPALMVIGGITIGLGSIVSMAGSVMGAIGGITASISAAVASLSAIFAEGGIAAVLSSIASAALPIVGAIAGITAVIGGAVVAVMAFKNAWDENYGGIRDKISKLIYEFKRLGRDVATALKTASKYLIQFINNLANSNGAKSVIVGVIDAIIIAIHAFRLGISKTIEFIKQFKQKLIETGTIEKLKTTFNSVKTAVTSAFTIMKGAVIGLANALNKELKPILEKHAGLFDKIQTVGAIAFSVLLTCIKAYTDAMTEYYSELKKAWDNNLYGIQDFVYGCISALGVLVDATLTVVNFLVESIIWLYNNWGAIRQQISNVVNGFIDFFIDVAKFIGNTFVSIANFVISIWGTIIKAIETSVNGIVATVNKLISWYNSVAGKLGLSKLSYLSSVSLSQYVPQKIDASSIEQMLGSISSEKPSSTNIVNNVTINSPTPLTPSKVAKEIARVNRQMLGGGF